MFCFWHHYTHDSLHKMKHSHCFWGPSPQQPPRMRPGAPVRQRDAAPPPCLSAPRAARAHGYNDLLHRSDWEPASVPSSEQQTHRHTPWPTPAPPAAGCPGEREGLWHRRTLFWRTSSGVQVVSPRAGARLVLGLVSPGGPDPDSVEYSGFLY